MILVKTRSSGTKFIRIAPKTAAGNVPAAPSLTEGGDSMPRKEHHVVPNPDGGWDVKRENAKRNSGHYDTKQEAMEAGRRMSINQGTELIPHRKDGTIQNPNSHGNDPCPPKDKK